MTLRKATLDDLDTLLPFAQHTFETAFGALWNAADLAHYFKTSYSREGLAAELVNPHCTFWFAEDDGKLLGFLQLETKDAPTAVRAQNPLFFHRVYVDTSLIGRGIGSTLMQLALDEAEKGKHDALYLTVWDINPAAVRLYHRWQFRKIDYVAFPIDSDIEPTDYLMLRDVGKVRVVPFAPQYAEEFKALNLAWIEQYFAVEDLDRTLLSDPQSHIIDQGGEIFLLLENDIVQGTCALIPTEKGVFELGKMAVHESAKGRGFGKLLLEAAIDHAKAVQANEIFLTSNTTLEPALRLYEKYGFETTWTGQHAEYKRGNIGMRKRMKE